MPKKINFPTEYIAVMANSPGDLFYSRLPVNEIPLSDLLTEDHLFYRVPETWHVVLTDIKKSTTAVEQGKSETVNLLATGSIVAVLNIAYRANLTVPFFFGGDGATFIIPASILTATLQALSIHRENTQKNYSLTLRVGCVPVTDIYKEGHLLRITKLRASQLFSIPVVLGDGLTYAEKVIKGDNYFLDLSRNNLYALDLSGMQCRWDKIKPPQNYDEVVSLIVTARENQKQAESFKKVIDKLDEIYGAPERRKPISVPMLKLKSTLEKISQEMRVRFGGYRLLYLLNKWITSLLGHLYFRTKQGKRYLFQLVDLSDTLVIDGRINTVISGTLQQRQQLVDALNELEAQGFINYGIFVSKESIMSCYVRNLNEDHIHFVDGSEGGYTRASVMLKRKFATA